MEEMRVETCAWSPERSAEKPRHDNAMAIAIAGRGRRFIGPF
jgi:hypothetical protein